MSYEKRRPEFNLSGTLTNGCTALDTSIASTAFTGLPTDYSNSLYLPLVLANDTEGKAEVVWATGHSAGAETLTVVRGREGTAGTAFAAGDVVRCAVTTRDVESTSSTRAALPTDAHYGMRVLIVDEGQVVEKTPSGWNDSAPLQSTTARRHHWTLTGGVVVSGNSDVLVTGLTPVPGEEGDIATVSGGLLTLHQAGLWTLVWQSTTDTTDVPGFFRNTLQWPGGAFMVTPSQQIARNAGGFPGAGTVINRITWTGYVTATQAAQGIRAIVGHSTTGGSSITTGVYDLTAEYLGA